MESRADVIPQCDIASSPSFFGRVKAGIAFMTEWLRLRMRVSTSRATSAIGKPRTSSKQFCCAYHFHDAILGAWRSSTCGQSRQRTIHQDGRRQAHRDAPRQLRPTPIAIRPTASSSSPFLTPISFIYPLSILLCMVDDISLSPWREPGVQ